MDPVVMAKRPVRDQVTSGRATPTKAVVLAAGLGKRLRPHTDVVPKPLLRIDGRPTLGYVLAALANSGVSEVCLVTHHLAGQIEEFVGDGSAWRLRAHCRRQHAPAGSGDALRTASPFIDGTCFVVAADYAPAPNSLRELKEFYLSGRADIAVSLKEIPTGEMNQRSGVVFDEDGRILEIIEKPERGSVEGNIAASLIFILPAAVRTFLADQKASRRGEYELQDVVNRMLAAGYTMAGLIQTAPREWRPPSCSASGGPGSAGGELRQEA